MDELKYCPRCQRLTPYINYGKFWLKVGGAVQRVRCNKCLRTFSISKTHPFFKGFHTAPLKFDKAMSLYSEGETIISIARQLKTRPNTIIDWIRRVIKYKSEYHTYLKNNQRYEPDRLTYFFQGFHFKSKQKRTRRIVAFSKARAEKRLSPCEPLETTVC